ncbi:MAG: CHAT domain-containing protein [Proteobacteria bacterium]|nr:CHAT domain-containing protein [Pseudomonadota bacterium]
MIHFDQKLASSSLVSEWSSRRRSCFFFFAITVAACATTSKVSVDIKETLSLDRVRPLPFKPVQITVGNDANLAPDMSDDGKSLVYTTSINGNKEIQVRNLETGKQSRITWHAADDFAPVISPDGSKVAFITRRSDAAGDLAIMNLGGIGAGLLSEREIFIANKQDTEELSPAWWNDQKKLLVPVRKGVGVPEILQLNVENLTSESLKWEPWGGNKGEFPHIHASGSHVSYVRGGRIFLNNAAGNLEQELKGLGGGVWTRPRFIDSSGDMLAIRYAFDTNSDGRIDGADYGSVWRFTANLQSGEVRNVFQLTSASINSYMPKYRENALYVTIQAKGSLEIFKFPKDGQARVEWQTFDEDKWFPHLKSVHDRIFALGSIARNLESQGKLKEAFRFRERMFLIYKDELTANDLNVFISDLKNIYGSDQSVQFMSRLFEIGMSIKSDMNAEQRGSGSAVGRKRLQEAAAKIAALNKESQSPKDQAPQMGAMSGSDFRAHSILILTQIQLALGNFEVASSQPDLIKTDVSKRISALKALLLAEVAAKRIGATAKEEILRDFLKSKSEYSDINLAAAKMYVNSVADRKLSSEELASLRQEVQKVPLLPPLLHELVAKRFIAEKKTTIAIQEYRQILIDHCISDGGMTVSMSRTYIELSLAEQLKDKANSSDNDETEKSLESLVKCVEQDETLKIEASTIRADALVRRGMVLMRDREFGAALKLFRLATEVDPNNISGWRGMIDASFRRKVLPELKPVLAARSETLKTSASAAYAYGYALTYDIDLASTPGSKLSAIDVSMLHISRAKDLDPSSIFPYQTLGWLNMQRGHWTKRYREDGGFFASMGSLFGKARELFGRPEDNYTELGIDSFQAALFLADDDSTEKANLVQNLGEAFYELENHQKALVFLGERAAMSKAHPFSDKAVEASVLKLAGRSAFQIEELDLAESLQKRSLEIWQSQGNDAQIVYALEAIALTLREAKKYSESISYYEQLLIRQQAQKSVGDISRTYSNIGYCQMMDGRLQDALVNFEESNKRIDAGSQKEVKKADSAISVDLGGQSTAAQGFDYNATRNMNLTFMARIFELQGKYQLAEIYYRKKIELLNLQMKDSNDKQKKVLREELSITHNNLGSALVESGQLMAAKDQLKLASQIAREIKSEESFSVDEAINLAFWARIELRLLVLGIKTGASMDEVRNRLQELMKLYREQLPAVAKTDVAPEAKAAPAEAEIKTAATVDPAEEQRKARKKLVSAWTPIVERIELLHFVLSSENLDTKAILERFEKEINQQDTIVRNIESKASRLRVSELSITASEMGIVPLDKVMLEEQKVARKNLLTLTGEPLTANEWRYHFEGRLLEPRKTAIEFAISQGHILESIYERRAIQSLSNQIFDDIMSKPNNNQSKAITQLRWALEVTSQSWRNGLNEDKTKAQYPAKSMPQKNRSKEAEVTKKAPVNLFAKPERDLGKILDIDEAMLVALDDSTSFRVGVIRQTSSDAAKTSQMEQVIAAIENQQKASEDVSSSPSTSETIYNGATQKPNVELTPKVKLETSIKNVYLSCLGPRCMSLKDGLEKTGRRVSILGTPEQLFGFKSGVKIAKSTLSIIGQRHGNENENGFKLIGSNLDFSFVSGESWGDVTPNIKGSHINVFKDPLLISSESPHTSEIKTDEKIFWPMKEASQGGRWYGTAMLFPNVVSRDPSMDEFEVYRFLTVWVEQLKVPTVFVRSALNTTKPSIGPAAALNEVPNKTDISSSKTVSNDDALIADLKVAISGTVLTPPPGYHVLGHLGLSESDALKFAAKQVGVVQDLALDALDAKDIESTKRYYMEALHYAELLKRFDDADRINTELVKTLFQARDYQGAFHFQKRKITSMKAKGATDEALAPMQVQAGILANRANLGALAREFFSEAEKWYQKDDDQIEMAKLYHNVALSYEVDGIFEKTVEYYEKSRAIYKKEGRKIDAAQKLLDIGNVYKERLNNFPVALDQYSAAYQEFDDAGDKGKLANVQIDRANTLMAMGETKWAINVLEQRVLNSIDPEDKPLLWARAAQIVANAYFRAGLFQESQAYIQKIFKRLPDIEDKTSQVNIEIGVANLNGMNLEKLGQHEEATKWFQNALSQAKAFRFKDKESMVLNNIGFWARERGFLQDSLKLFEDALKIDKELKSEADQAYDLRNLAMTMTLMGDLSGAKNSADQALIISSRLKLAHNEAYSLFALAEIALKKKSYDEAVSLFIKARTVAEKAYLQDFVWRAYAATASVLSEQGKNQEAIDEYTKAVDIIESLRAGLASESSKTGFASDRGVQDVYGGIVRSLMKIGKIEQAWVYSERGRARAFIDALGGRTMTFGEKELDDLVDVEKRLRSDIEILERKLAILPADSPDRNQVTTSLAKKKEERIATVKKIEAKWPKVTALLGVTPLTVKAVNAKLGNESVLLEYMTLDNETAYWVIGAGGIKGGLLPIGRQKLAGLISKYRDLMQNFAAVQAMAKDISQEILETPLKDISSGKDLIIVPHAELHYLPFASLPVGSEFLLDEFPIVFLESAEMLRFEPVEPRKLTAQSKIGALGNPSRGPDLDLPFAGREVKAIKRKFANSDVLFGADATEAKFKIMSGQSDIIHFAGHGEFIDHDPSSSRLLLAGADDLTVKEMFELRMPVSLITLSACETGLGKLSSGDEIVGFNRALFFAGAESIISSLWRVSDVASSVTVKRFYGAIAKGESKAHALRSAQLLARRYFSHPAYWSAFKLSGDGR